jgi:D-alanyl-D-alanine dipeptidase
MLVEFILPYFCLMNRNFWLPMLVLGYLLPCLALRFEAKEGIFDTCRQLVVVVSPKDRSVKARLFKFEKKGKNWQQVGGAHLVNLGRKGLAWGRGLNSAKPGLQKKEGDQRSPAGIFRFGAAFGYASVGPLDLKLPYIPITEAQICVEDGDSKYYNQVVDASQVEADWEQREPMLRKDEQYKWGIFVKQNLPPEPGAGSCIFFHLWRKPGSGTLGCTAMDEANLLSLMQWLDPQKEPLLLQMTEAAYADYQRKFSLPSL